MDDMVVDRNRVGETGRDLLLASAPKGLCRSFSRKSGASEISLDQFAHYPRQPFASGEEGGPVSPAMA